MDRPSCESCPYFRPDDVSKWFSGQCRFGPPVKVSVSGIGARYYPDGSVASEGHSGSVSSWPSVYPNEYCGRHPEFNAWVESEKHQKE